MRGAVPRRRNPSVPLGARFSLLLLGGTTVGVVFVSLLLNYVTGQWLRVEMRENAKALVSALDWAVAPLVASGDMGSVQRLLENVGSSPGVRNIRVYDVTGRVIASNVLAEKGGILPESTVATVFEAQRLFAISEDFRTNELAVAVPLRGSTDETARRSDIAAAIFLRPDVAQIERQNAPFQSTLIASGVALSVILVAMYTAFMYRWVLVPLRLLTRATSAVSSGDYATRAEPGLPGELGNFAKLFNAMLDEIEQKNRDLLTHANELERRVLERTRSLEDAKHALEEAYDELKGTQAHLVETARMASIGQLAAGVAHEINNPMAFIKSNLTTLKRYAGQLREFTAGALGGQDIRALASRSHVEEVMEDLAPLLEDSLEGSARVEAIVRSLKGFSHADTGEVSRVDLNALLDDTLRVIWNRIKYKAKVEKEYGQIPLVRCFAQRLNQVFLNLLTNAADAIERNGVIGIRTWESDGRVHVAITDNGCGIPENLRSRIFEPFFTTKEVGAGTGLGLAISYGIVQNHGGKIIVESAKGAGTTFTVTLPIDGSPAMDA
jgi:signal transduction histidine kinase